MKIKVGDRVKFLNDIGSGEVTRIIDQKTALVQIDGGFEMPTLIKELVVAGGSYGREEEEEDEVQQLEKPKSFSENIEDQSSDETLEDEEVALAFVPDKNSSQFETFLINSSSYQFKYTISRQQDGELVLFHEGTLEAGIKINLGSYQARNLSDEEIFRIQGIFYNKGFYRHLPPVDMLIKMTGSEMYDAERWVENDYFYEKVLAFEIYNWKKKAEKPGIEIDSDELRKAMLTKGDLEPKKKAEKKEKKPGIEEVDLHIHELVDDNSKMENKEILDIQLAKFRTSLESAIIHKMRKIVFIHGVGNGKLKHEIRRTLDHEYKNLRYQDASFKEYGYGATMVLIS